MDMPNEGRGVYFDGETGAPHSVSVRLEEAALAIAGADGAKITRWNYPEVERLPAPESRLRLGLASRSSTARLEIREPAFAQAAEDRLGMRDTQIQASERRYRHRVVEWSIGAVGAVLLIGMAGIPALAELLLPLIPRSAEVPYGAAAHAATKDRFKEGGAFECGEAGDMERAGKAVFMKMFIRLERAANLPIPLSPFVIRTQDVNAIAMPGGYIHVFAGIIEQTQTPEELAGVIGHEFGHVARRDAMTSLLHTAGLSYLFGVALGDVVGSGGMIAAAHKVLGNRHTRGQEAAADQFGVALLRKLGADPYALANVFERWSKDSQPSRNMLVLYDHPANAHRVAAIRAMPAVANPTPLLSGSEWQVLKQICSGR